MISFKSYRKDDTDIIEIHGKLEDSQTQYFIDYFESIFNTGPKNIILDLSKLDYISSSGLGVISAKYISMKIRGGRLILCNMQSKIEKVFQITKILKIIPSYNSLNEALSETKEYDQT